MRNPNHADSSENAAETTSSNGFQDANDLLLADRGDFREDRPPGWCHSGLRLACCWVHYVLDEEEPFCDWYDDIDESECNKNGKWMCCKPKPVFSDATKTGLTEPDKWNCQNANAFPHTAPATPDHPPEPENPRNPAACQVRP